MSDVTITDLARPALRYFGGKFRLAEQIISLMPRHECYVEPFSGGASVLLRKSPSPIEVYNDLSGDVVTVFRVLRDRPAELIRAIELTPFARAEVELSYLPADDELEQARRLYVRSHQRRGGPSLRWRTGWLYQRTNSRGKPIIDNWQETYHLWQIASRLRRVQIECDDALAVIRRFDGPETLFYVEPPYPHSSRGGHNFYEHELTDDDHRHLAEVLHSVRGMVLISSYPNVLYDELYATWQCFSFSSRTQASKVSTECVWISPAASARRLPLFADL